MDTYHAEFWSDPSYSSSEEDNDRYNDTIMYAIAPAADLAVTRLQSDFATM